MIESIFLDSVIKRFQEYKNLGEKTFEQLTDEEMLFQPNNESNSIACIIQHMHGNMLSRWTNFLTEDGEKSWRNRDAEFEIQMVTKEKLVTLWLEGWSIVLQTLSSLHAADLNKTITIRKEPHTVPDAILRQLAHYSYHVGQIVYLGKCIKGENWKILSIGRNESLAFNKRLMK